MNDNKQRLTESFSKDWKEPLVLNKLVLNESCNKTIIQEGKEFTPLSRWEIPVWRLDKRNLNGRTYRESLGRRIESECKDLVTANLADHPSQDGSIRDILSVSGNPHIKEGILWVDTTVVDETFDKKLKAMAEAGFGLGVSSSILGEVDRQGFVVDESVIMERYFDYVLEPSYSVFVKKENKMSESVDSTINQKNSTDKNKGDLQVEKDTKVSVMEKAFKLNIKSLITEAEKKKTISEKINAFEEISLVVDDSFPELNESVNTKLKTLREEALVLAEKASVVDTLNESLAKKETEQTEIKTSFDSISEENAGLKERYEKSCGLLDELKKQYNKALELIETQSSEVGSRFTATEYEKVLTEKQAILKERKEMVKAGKAIQEKANKLKKIASVRKQNLILAENKNKRLVRKLNEAKQLADTNKDLLLKEQKNKATKVKESNENSLLHVRNNNTVKNYYNDLCESDSRYKTDKIAKQVLGCKTIMEAQVKVLKLKNLVEKNDTTSQLLNDNLFSDGQSLYNGINYESNNSDTGYDYTK